MQLCPPAFFSDCVNGLILQTTLALINRSVAMDICSADIRCETIPAGIVEDVSKRWESVLLTHSRRRTGWMLMDHWLTVYVSQHIIGTLPCACHADFATFSVRDYMTEDRILEMTCSNLISFAPLILWSVGRYFPGSQISNPLQPPWGNFRVSECVMSPLSPPKVSGISRDRIDKKRKKLWNNCQASSDDFNMWNAIPASRIRITSQLQNRHRHHWATRPIRPPRSY